MSENVYPKANEGGETAHVAPNPSFPDMEETVLDYWDKDDTFQKSVERNPSGDHSQNEFVFFDGPPFANGLPHYGHLLTGYAKDVIPRYPTQGLRQSAECRCHRHLIDRHARFLCDAVAHQ